MTQSSHVAQQEFDICYNENAIWIRTSEWHLSFTLQ